ncbi:hypothetical protein GCM10027598_79340 [Amycolatopsis oliviviridis]|uniref:DUF3592 domain-containing protein n=1 Tax=Amycolatopsis oliviviridis TaxID=1471590 RepID=A0ABQ3L5P7_9PSEU|nr:DUF3592 domain-containing protein [Amycolatopsis oliviviridis]GHH05400.1 hypothetical protein GCM10017790_09270 [Amycolatopsis oliviviridis]
MTSLRSRLRGMPVLWLPLALLVCGLVVLVLGISIAVDVNRSAGLTPGRVVATASRDSVTADVEYTGSDGITRTETFEHHQGSRRVHEGDWVQIRVWPDEQRAEFDEGDKHTGAIVMGSVLALLGAGAIVALVLWHHGVRMEKPRARLHLWWCWLVSFWR